MKCRRCGNIVPSTSSYCAYCGTAQVTQQAARTRQRVPSWAKWHTYKATSRISAVRVVAILLSDLAALVAMLSIVRWVLYNPAADLPMDVVILSLVLPPISIGVWLKLKAKKHIFVRGGVLFGLLIVLLGLMIYYYY